MIRIASEQKIWLKENKLKPSDYKIMEINKTKELRNKWREVFISTIKDKSILHMCPACSRKEMRSYDWHAFSYEKVKAEKINEDFLSRKLIDKNIDLYLIWEECNASGLIIKSDIIKNCKHTCTDIYIFDDTFSWTYVATHEEMFFYKDTKI